MPVSHDDVRAIAALARLAVPPEHFDRLANELSGILGHMEALGRLDDESGTQDADAVAGMRLAPDAGPSVSLTLPLSGIAPVWKDGFFLVPRLDTHGDATGGSTEGDHS